MGVDPEGHVKGCAMSHGRCLSEDAGFKKMILFHALPVTPAL